MVRPLLMPRMNPNGPKKFTILDRELSIESGDLTPSMKLRRKVVVGKAADDISALYG